MEIIILAFFTALSKMIIISKVWGLSRALHYEKWIDLFFMIVLPIMFMGTFSGALLAVFSGLWLSLLLRASRLFVTLAPVNEKKHKTNRR